MDGRSLLCYSRSSLLAGAAVRMPEKRRVILTALLHRVGSYCFRFFVRFWRQICRTNSSCSPVRLSGRVIPYLFRFRQTLVLREICQEMGAWSSMKLNTHLCSPQKFIAYDGRSVKSRAVAWLRYEQFDSVAGRITTRAWTRASLATASTTENSFNRMGLPNSPTKGVALSGMIFTLGHQDKHSVRTLHRLT